MSGLLELRGLTRRFRRSSPWLRRSRGDLAAVADIDLDIGPGEVVALVGESGSGKTTLARLVLRLLRPTSGSLRFQGEDLLALRGAALRRSRRHLQGVFQDPLAALDPRQTAADAIGEPLDVHRLAAGEERKRRIASLLSEVELAAGHGSRYPHELSGGERQRVVLARALATDPRLLVADEPVSALDTPLRGRLIELLVARRRDRDLAMLLVSHDFESVRRLADRVLVLFAGRAIERGPTPQVTREPLHPYTVALVGASRGLATGPAGGLAAGPRPEGAGEGCPYSRRCPAARDRCHRDRPALAAVGADRAVACHFPGEWKLGAGGAS